MRGHAEGKQGRSQVHRGQQDPLVHELTYLEGLMDAVPAGDIMVEERDDLGVRMQGEIASQLS